MKFAASQQWSYRAPSGHEGASIVIGAIATCASGEHIICFSALDVPKATPSGDFEKITIPFIPMRESAFEATVQTLLAEDADPPADFSEALRRWSEDQRGLSIFTVPFEGDLDRMIALQMAAIVGKPAA